MWLGSCAFQTGSRQLKLTPYRSPNCGPRRDGAFPDLVVLHYTAMQSATAARDTLCHPEAEVSAHYLIAEDGEVFSLVPEELRAWHAGAGQWGSVTDVNSRSIGIELANTGTCPFAAVQMNALEEVLEGIYARWAMRPERLIGHSDMAPSRKIDPGPRFDWRRLARSGFGVWPELTDETGEFRQSMEGFGYTAPQDDAQLLRSFRMRFRPHATGPLDDIDRALIADLAKRYPVDGPRA